MAVCGQTEVQNENNSLEFKKQDSRILEKKRQMKESSLVNTMAQNKDILSYEIYQAVSTTLGSSLNSMYKGDLVQTHTCV